MENECQRNVIVDELGRIIISSHIKEKLGLAKMDKLKMNLHGNSIIMEKVNRENPKLKLLIDEDGLKHYILECNIVRSIDEINRIVLPIEFRHKLGITDGNKLEEKVNDNKIILTKI